MNPHPTDADSLSAYAERLERERDAALARAEADKGALKLLCLDIADDDTRIRELARPFLKSWVDGDPEGVPTIVDVVEKLIHTLAADYIHKDDVKLLLDVITTCQAESELAWNFVPAAGMDQNLPVRNAIRKIWDATIKAISHAREKGLL